MIEGQLTERFTTQPLKNLEYNIISADGNLGYLNFAQINGMVNVYVGRESFADGIRNNRGTKAFLLGEMGDNGIIKDRDGISYTLEYTVSEEYIQPRKWSDVVEKTQRLDVYLIQILDSQKQIDEQSKNAAKIGSMTFNNFKNPKDLNLVVEISGNHPKIVEIS